MIEFLTCHFLGDLTKPHQVSLLTLLIDFLWKVPPSAGLLARRVFEQCLGFGSPFCVTLSRPHLSFPTLLFFPPPPPSRIPMAFPTPPEHQPLPACGIHIPPIRELPSPPFCQLKTLRPIGYQSLTDSPFPLAVFWFRSFRFQRATGPVSLRPFKALYDFLFWLRGIVGTMTLSSPSQLARP